MGIEQFWDKARDEVTVVATQLLKTPMEETNIGIQALHHTAAISFIASSMCLTCILTLCQMDTSSSCPGGH